MVALKTFDPPLSALGGMKVIGTSRYGKMPVVQFEGGSEGRLDLLVHLMSAGRLQVFDKRASLRDRASRVLIRLTDGRELRLREFGTKQRAWAKLLREGEAKLSPFKRGVDLSEDEVSRVYDALAVPGSAIDHYEEVIGGDLPNKMPLAPEGPQEGRRAVPALRRDDRSRVLLRAPGQLLPGGTDRRQGDEGPPAFEASQVAAHQAHRIRILRPSSNVIEDTLLAFALDPGYPEQAITAGISRVESHYGPLLDATYLAGAAIESGIGVCAWARKGHESAWPRWAERDGLAVATSDTPSGWSRLTGPQAAGAEAALRLGGVIASHPERALE
ncbi:MAG: hypothetical protein M3331_07885, partial [Actinomycetota bacterium]|nr:hypothetical protein [Actinomycetota bacterium]